MTRSKTEVGRRACRIVRTAVAALVVCACPTLGQIITEDAGFKAAPDTPILQEWFSISEMRYLSESRLEHRLFVRPDHKTEFKIAVPTVLSRRVSFRNLLGGRSSATLAGVGDLTVSVKRSLWQTDDVMVSNRWAFLGEVTAPTGRHDRRGGGVDIPRMLQLGSGSWGFGAGTAFTLIRDRHRFSTEVMYRHRFRHDGFRRGDSIDANIAYWYRLTPAQFDAEADQTELRGVVELLNRYHFDSKGVNHGGGDHGLETWALLGLQWFPRIDLLVDFGIQIPVIETVNDEMGDRRWKAVVGVRFLF